MKLRWLQDEQKMQNGQSKHSDYFFQVIIQTVTHTYEHTHWTCTLCLIKKKSYYKRYKNLDVFVLFVLVWHIL